MPSYKPSFFITLDASSFEEPDGFDDELVRQQWKRALNGRIAQALGIRRQYVDAVVRTNNFAQIRNFVALFNREMPEWKIFLLHDFDKVCQNIYVGSLVQRGSTSMQ